MWPFKNEGNQAIDTLVAEYPGDYAWSDFWSSYPAHSRRAGLPDDIAAVVFAKLGEHADDWLKTPIPALGGQSPAAVLRRPNGWKAIRSLLMRMP
ncbi:DUF2384 domain-containing protein [Rhizobium sp. CRIBSB]|nr:DUF2384 domain-containing protein [Rhizobium sp. CRIBSB]